MNRTHRYRMLILPFLLIVMLGLVSVLSVSAKNSQKVTDNADILSEWEEEKLQEQLLETAEQYQCDVVVLTTDSCGRKSPQDYTDDYYYENGYGYGRDIDGIMLMVSMGDRKFHLATRGAAIDIFTDYGLEIIDEEISPYLSDGAYYEAFSVFGKMAEEFMAQYELYDRGYAQDSYSDYGYTDYGYSYVYEEKMSMDTRLLIAGIAALLITGIVVAVLFAQLKSVGVERRAHEYIRQGSFRVTRSRDVFLYRTVQKVRKQKDDGGGGSRTHRTSGGGRAGGRTGSF